MRAANDRENKAGTVSDTCPRPEEKPPVSVIIPVDRKDSENILRCLECLAVQDFEEDFEVLLAVTENTVLDIDSLRRFKFVHCTCCSAGSGPGGVRNAAMAKARGEIFLFTDADCLPENSWIHTMVQSVRQRNGLPVRGLVRIGKDWDACMRASDFAESGIGKPRKPVPINGWSGSNMGCGRKWYDAGARFAEYIYGGEEAFFLSQFGDAADKVMLLPSAVVIHDRPMDFGQAYSRMYRIGAGSGYCRRRLKTRGSFFAKYPLAAFLLIPGRLLLTLWRMRACTLSSSLEFIMLSPIIVMFWFGYSLGFASGARAFVPEEER